MKFDDPESFVYSKYAAEKGLDHYGQGLGMIWPFGGEHWCNLEGAYVHIVSVLSHFED